MSVGRAVPLKTHANVPGPSDEAAVATLHPAALGLYPESRALHSGFRVAIRCPTHRGDGELLTSLEGL